MKAGEPFVLAGDVLRLRAWEQQFGLFAGFSTKNGGASTDEFASLNLSYVVGDNLDTVRTNRRILAANTPVAYDKWVFAEQAHTNHIMEVTQADCGAGVFTAENALRATDGMYTSERGIMLATFHADCTPIYCYSPTQHLIGLVHAGWSGTVKGITNQLLTAWFSRGVDPADIYLVFGPAATQAVYEVDEHVAKQVKDMGVEDAGSALVAKADGKYLLDTPYLNYLIAATAGVPTDNMMQSKHCTITEEDLFFSYRRARQTGRMLAFMCQ
jgi:hypothetical protein